MTDFSISNMALHFLSWGFTYVLHSSILVLLLWLWFKKRPTMSLYLKDVLLKTVLIAGIFTAGLQLYGNKGLDIAIGAQPTSNKTIQQPVSQPLFIQNMLPAIAKTMHSTTSSRQTQANASGFTIHWYEVLALSWFLVVMFLFIRFMWLKDHFIRSLKIVSAPKGSLENLLKNLSNQLKLTQEVQLLLVANTLSPLVLNKRTIVVPIKALEELSLEQQESMLAHELAHLQRRDDLWLKLSQALQIGLFFQPLNRWVFQQIYEVTEQICDAKAVQVTQNTQALAKCLVEVASWFTSQPRWVVSMAARQKPLTRRVKQLLNNKNMQNSTKPRFLAPLPIATAIGLVVIIAIFTLPGIQFSWAQVFKKNPKAKAFKAYTLNVSKESNGQYQQAIVIKNPQGKISEFYVDDQKYAAQDLSKFSFLNQALENYEVRRQNKRAYGEELKKLEIEAQKNKIALENAYVKASKIKNKEAKKKRMIEIKKEAQKVKESFDRKKKEFKQRMSKKPRKR